MSDLIALEIWDEFRELSDTDTTERMGYGEAKAHFGIKFEDRLDASFGDRRIDVLDWKLTTAVERQDLTWDELRELYPMKPAIYTPPKHPRYPTPKFRTIEENRRIETVLRNDWQNMQSRIATIFPKEQDALRYLQDVRWQDGVTCIYCGHDRCYVLTNYQSKFQCAKCRKRFSERAASIFANSKLPMSKWFEAMYLMTSTRTRKLSTHQMSRALGVTQKTSLSMMRNLAPVLNEEVIKRLRIGLFEDSLQCTP